MSGRLQDTRENGLLVPTRTSSLRTSHPAQSPRGGAVIPIGIKKDVLRKSAGFPKHLIYNNDEGGDSGIFKCWHLMENGSHGFIEGMVICTYATGTKMVYRLLS